MYLTRRLEMRESPPVVGGWEPKSATARAKAAFTACDFDLPCCFDWWAQGFVGVVEKHAAHQ